LEGSFDFAKDHAPSTILKVNTKTHKIILPKY